MPKFKYLLAVLAVCVLGGLLFVACKKEENATDGFNLNNLPHAKLSSYGFFEGAMANLQVKAPILPYDLNTPLFTDYAFKARFVYVPTGQKAQYDAVEAFKFPENSVLIKNFYYPADFRNPDGPRKILETRLLILKNQKWETYTYVWDEAQQEAALLKTGKTIPISWTHYDGASKSTQYLVPNQNQCKSCHELDKVSIPIGPKAMHLNRTYAYADGAENQLTKWAAKGILDGAPNPANAPKLIDWHNPNDGTVEQRARAYLDANCAHCHNERGSANNSGLWLDYGQTDRYHLGFCKIPVSAGSGTGGHRWDIAMGKPDSSILVYRMETNDPGTQMPEVGRSIIHQEGIDAVRAWIMTLEGNCQ